jgi:hypothetical protein
MILPDNKLLQFDVQKISVAGRRVLFLIGYDRLVLSRSRSDRGGPFTLRLEVNTLTLRLRDSANALPQPEGSRTRFIQNAYSK